MLLLLILNNYHSIHIRKLFDATDYSTRSVNTCNKCECNTECSVGIDAFKSFPWCYTNNFCGKFGLTG